MSGDPEQEFFADGLTEDIVTALSHYRWFFVIARNSSFAYKGRSIDVKQIARELGVRYILEGSVRKAGGRVRVTGQLIEAETGAHLWAERYDRDVADIFAIQDELAQQVVGAIEPEILMGEGRRALQKPTGNLDAYECCMRGMWHHDQSTAEHLAEAIRWHRQALALDPGFGRAHMALARALWGRCLFGYSDDIGRDIDELRREADRAMAIDDRDPYAHYAMFGCHLLSGRHQMALAAAQRAIDLNPNFALGHHALGLTRIVIGHFAEALEPLHTAMRLSPHDPRAYLFLSRLALAQYHLGNYEEAAQYAERALASRRAHFILITLLASLGQLGRTEEARALLPEIAATESADPTRYWEVVLPYADPTHREQLVVRLRKAGYAGFQ
jgi:TolB-like protein